MKGIKKKVHTINKLNFLKKDHPINKGNFFKKGHSVNKRNFFVYISILGYEKTYLY